MQGLETKVITVPPPILTRVFHELAGGMVRYHDAYKVAHIPFPFPYSQTTLIRLILHWLLIPFVMVQHTRYVTICGIFTVVQVFLFWALNMVAVQIEKPFGTDGNDIDLKELQQRMNTHLVLIMSPVAQQLPILSEALDNNQLAKRLVRHNADPRCRLNVKSFMEGIAFVVLLAGCGLIVSMGEITGAQQLTAGSGTGVGVQVMGMGRSIQLQDWQWWWLGYFGFGSVWAQETVIAMGQFALSHATVLYELNRGEVSHYTPLLHGYFNGLCTIWAR